MPPRFCRPSRSPSPTRSAYRIVAGLAAALSALSCRHGVASDTAPASVTSRSEIAVGWFGQSPAFADPGPLRVRLGLDPSAIEVRGSDLEVPEGSVWFESRRYPVPESGSLPILVTYLGPSGDTLARASVAIDRLMPGFSYGVNVYAGGRNPASSGQSICGSPPHAVPVRRPGSATVDSLYITTGGLPKGAVC